MPTPQRLRAFALRLATTSLLLLLSAAYAQAVTITVTRSDDRDATCDSGVDCSLREAVKLANNTVGDDTIKFDLPQPATITLSNGDIDITSNVKITGPGAENYRATDGLTINGGNMGRIFAIVGSNLTVSIQGLVLKGGNGGGPVADGHGGAIFHQGTGSLLTLDTVKLMNNHTGANNDGGAVFSQFGSLTVRNSSFSGNKATRSGGGISFEGAQLMVTNTTFDTNMAQGSSDFGGGAIFTQSNAAIINRTFSDNKTNYGGGGVYLLGAGGTVWTIRNSTFTANSAQFGGGIFHQQGTTNLYNSIVALNTAATIPSSDNIYSDGTLNQSNNYTGADPKLGPLTDNGGPTETHGLLPGSPAITALSSNGGMLRSNLTINP